ncbi:MAG TPA: ATP-dependent DNA ligase [Actinomycetota bacterium]|nr:ATP-dependent DNA ligase [Actinomycetota bacterium]
MRQSFESVRPMLCRLEEKLPSGPDWVFEPKWDGFRGILFKDGGRVRLASRNGKDLGAYFPNLIAAAASLPDCAIDGEIVAVKDGKQEFELLQQALAGSKVPVALVAFDQLWLDGVDLTGDSFDTRRSSLEESISPTEEFQVTPQTHDRRLAEEWIRDLAPMGFEGVVAKRKSFSYKPGERAMVKVKHWETSDFVVGGYTGPLGDPRALLLGAFDSKGVLHHVGGTGFLSSELREAFKAHLGELEGGSGFTGIQPSANRWQSHRLTNWVPVTPRLVIEVLYNRMDSGRIRHSARFVRWRPDKRPEECVMTW